MAKTYLRNGTIYVPKADVHVELTLQYTEEQLTKYITDRLQKMQQLNEQYGILFSKSTEALNLGLNSGKWDFYESIEKKLKDISQKIVTAHEEWRGMKNGNLLICDARVV